MLHTNRSKETTGMLFSNYSLSAGTAYTLLELHPHSIGKPGVKKERTSQHIVQFVLDILYQKETNKTDLISDCIIKLDNLAIQIDSLIDSKCDRLPRSNTLKKFPGLEKQIINCFEPLRSYSDIEDLINSTIKCVNLSFKFNTADRHIIYSLEKGVYHSRCTTYYLFPLFRYLYAETRENRELDRVFFHTANYVQLLDDFIDLFIDVNSGIRTPVSKRYLEEKDKIIDNISNRSPFYILTLSVKEKLYDFLNVIEIEISKVRGTNPSKQILQLWYKFHIEMEKIPVPIDGNDLNEQKYLEKLRYVVPPIICYH